MTLDKNFASFITEFTVFWDTPLLTATSLNSLSQDLKFSSVCALTYEKLNNKIKKNVIFFILSLYSNIFLHSIKLLIAEFLVSLMYKTY